MNGQIILGWFHLFYRVLYLSLIVNIKFSFILLSTDFGQSKSDLAHRYGVLCPRYRSTFIDNEWFKMDVIFNNFELILSSAIHTVPVPVGEALVSFLGMIALTTTL